MRFKISWASRTVGSKFTVLALFFFVFEGNFPSTSPQGAYIWRGDLTEGFFALPDWGGYIWRGLYMEGLIFGILRYFSLFFAMLNLTAPLKKMPQNVVLFKGHVHVCLL